MSPWITPTRPDGKSAPWSVLPAFWSPPIRNATEHDRERVVAGEGGDDDPGVAVVLPLEPVRVGVERVPEVPDLARAAQARRSRPRSPSPRGSCGACACRRSARRAASRRAPAPRSRTAFASTGPEQRPRRATASRRRAAATIPPARGSSRPGQTAESGSSFPVGNDRRVEALRLPPVRLGVEDQVRQQVRRRRS